VINKTTLARLAALTFVLGVISALIGPDRDFLWIVDDVAFFGLIICVMVLVVLTVAVLAKSARGAGTRRAS
jgi:hypothetical protein